MGQIYQNSYLTVVAAYAEDGTEGCFFDCSSLRKEPMVQIPYVTKEGTTSGTLYVKAKLLDFMNEENPALGSACTRAWVLQEELLSRRKVYYMKRTMLWACQQLEILETSEGSPMVPLEWKWDSIVSNYTKRALTYPTDKLVALQGLANTMAKQRPDDQYVDGLWHSDLPGALLWFNSSENRLEQITELTLPTWLWASRNGGIEFLMTDPYEVEHETTTFRVEDPGIIVLNAPVLSLMGLNDASSLRTILGADSEAGLKIGFTCHWPLGIGNVESAYREKSGVDFLPTFDDMVKWLASNPSR